MKFKKIHLLIDLLIVLILMYAINIFSLNKITNSLLGNPIKLSLTVLNPDQDQCTNCFNADSLVSYISSLKGITITQKKTITPKSFEYENLVEKNGIKNLPAIIMSGNIIDVKVIKIVKLLSGENKNGNIIIQNLLPNYNIKTQEKQGFIDVVLLEDQSCKDCFNATQYLNTLKRSGMAVATSYIYDISSPKGKYYIKKYNIKKIPTLLISPQANDYPGFRELWKNVGTVAPDGWLIFRKVQIIGGRFSNI